MARPANITATGGKKLSAFSLAHFFNIYILAHCKEQSMFSSSSSLPTFPKKRRNIGVQNCAHHVFSFGCALLFLPNEGACGYPAADIVLGTTSHCCKTPHLFFFYFLSFALPFCVSIFLNGAIRPPFSCALLSPSSADTESDSLTSFLAPTIFRNL